MALDMDGHSISRRKALKVSVAALLSEAGFGMAEDLALETLTEALQAYIGEIGRSTKAHAEHSGRTEPMVSDVVMGLINIGLDIRGIPTHAKRPNKSVFMPPAMSSHSPTPKTLMVGERRPHPPHIPDHLPDFPDPHTYIKTDAIRQPLNEYQVIREKAATQKRFVERSLTRLIARTGETQSLFTDDFKAFPLIAVKPGCLPYIDALLSRDQDLVSLEQELGAQLSSSSAAAAAASGTAPHPYPYPHPSASSSSSLDPSCAGGGVEENGEGHMLAAGLDELSQYLQSQQQQQQDLQGDSEAIDNPYLRGGRLPKRKRFS